MAPPLTKLQVENAGLIALLEADGVMALLKPAIEVGADNNRRGILKAREEYQSNDQADKRYSIGKEVVLQIDERLRE